MIALPSPWSWPTLLVLGWLAWRFGKTLRYRETPLIEQIARVSTPGLTPELIRYARLLTTIWSFYFLIAFSTFFVAAYPPLPHGVLVSVGSICLFLLEFWIRPHLFKGVTFPDLPTQIADTWRVWNKKTTATPTGKPDQ